MHAHCIPCQPKGSSQPHLDMASCSQESHACMSEPCGSTDQHCAVYEVTVVRANATRGPDDIISAFFQPAHPPSWLSFPK
jgi:hypothetical protein